MDTSCGMSKRIPARAADRHCTCQRFVCVVALFAISFAAGPLATQERGAAGAGRALAQRLCTECHAIEPGQSQSPATSAPPFARIAAVPGMTSAALRVALQTSHRTMPNVMLQPDQLDDVVAYILSLQSAR